MGNIYTLMMKLLIYYMAFIVIGTKSLYDQVCKVTL